MVIGLAVAVLLMLAAAVLYSLFGPNPPIVVSKQTTFLTAPLGPDGLPDYAAFLLAKSRKGRSGKGVTPENNGAVPFLKAMGFDSENFNTQNSGSELNQLVCDEVGLEYPLDTEQLITPIDTPEHKQEALRLLRDRLARPTITEGNPAPEIDFWGGFDGGMGFGTMPLQSFLDADDERALEDGRVSEFIWWCEPVPRPWTADDLPFLAAWLEQNNAGIDLLVEAAVRPEWHLPEATLLLPKQESSLSSFRNIQQLRGAARHLQTRCNYSRGLAEYKNAARDAMTILRLAEHTATGPFLIDQLVALAVAGIGLDLVQQLAWECDDPEILSEMLAQFNRLGPLCDMDTSSNLGERIFCLDYALRAAQGIASEEYEQSDTVTALSHARIDWNEVLRAVNQFQDAVLAARKSPTWAQRDAALTKLDNQTAGLPKIDAQSFLTPTSRGRLLGAIWLREFYSSTSSLHDSEDRHLMQLELTRIAVALALFRAERGELPEKLDELTPDVLSKLPIDLFKAAPFHYRLTDDGYLLYSAGPNGTDDGGSNDGATYLHMPIYEGQVLDEAYFERYGYEQDPDTFEWSTNAGMTSDTDPMSNIPPGADDIPLRMPPPPPDAWPWEATEDSSAGMMR